MEEETLESMNKNSIEKAAVEVTKSVLSELTPILNKQQDLTMGLFKLVEQQQEMTASHHALTNTVISRMDALEGIVQQHIDKLASLETIVRDLAQGKKVTLDNKLQKLQEKPDDNQNLNIEVMVSQKQLLYDQKRLMQERRKMFVAQEEQFTSDVIDLRGGIGKLQAEMQQKLEVMPENIKRDPTVQDMVISMNTRFGFMNNKLKGMETAVSKHEELIFTKDLEIAEMEKEILKKEKEMSKDPLTGLYNVGYLNHVIANEDGRWVGITIDLDNFKRINDTFGHAEGDRVLKDTAKCIHEAVTSMADTSRKIYIFRRGGDEMAVLVKCRARSEGATELNLAMKLAEEIRYRVEANGDVTVSVGVGGILLDTPCDKLLFEQHKDEVLGDKAAYEAKNSGRNKVCGPKIEFGAPVAVLGGKTDTQASKLDQRQAEVVDSLKALAESPEYGGRGR